MHASTTVMPAIPSDRIVASWNTSRLDNAAATVHGGEHDGAAAARHRAPDRVGNVEAGAALLAEPADHQQAVVDAEPDAEHHHDVQRVERHVGDRRDRAQRDHRREHAAERDRERQAGGDDAAEHDRHDDDRDRQRDQLGALRVLLGAVGELTVDEQLPADEHLRARRCRAASLRRSTPPDPRHRHSGSASARRRCRPLRRPRSDRAAPRPHRASLPAR